MSMPPSGDIHNQLVTRGGVEVEVQTGVDSDKKA